MSKKMTRGFSPGAKKRPEHIKQGEVVLAKYRGIWWPSQIRNFKDGKVTYDFLPLTAYPGQHTKQLKSIKPFDKKIPDDADNVLKDAYEAAFLILDGIGQKSLPKTGATASADEPTTSHASLMLTNAKSSSRIQGKLLASAVMSDAPAVKFVKDEVVMASNRDKAGVHYQWPALIREVKETCVICTFFPIKTKEVLVTWQYAAISPFPLKHARAMIEEAGQVSTDLAEALHNAVTYLELNNVDVPPEPLNEAKASSRSVKRTQSTVKGEAANAFDGGGTSADTNVRTNEELVHQEDKANANVDQPIITGDAQKQSTSGSSLSVTPTTVKVTASARSTIVTTPRVRKPKIIGQHALPAKSVDEDEAKHVDSPLTSAGRRPRQQSRVSGSVEGDTPAVKKKHQRPTELSAEEQLGADHPKKEDSIIQIGARVFGPYGKALYPALVCGSESNGRYRIYFVEDGKPSVVSSAAIFPLSDLTPGVTAMISPPGNLSANSIGREIKILAAPDNQSPQEWKNGKFTVRDAVTGEESTADWTQFYFREQDANALKTMVTSRAASASIANRSPDRLSRNPSLVSAASKPLGTSGFEQESDDLDDIKAGQADTSADAKKCNVQTPRENATRGTVASSARTPAKPTPQQLPIPTATRKRVTAVVTNPSDTDARPPLKRQRRDLKDSQAAKVEDIHVQPLVSTPATIAVTQEQQIVSEAQSKPTKGQHALPVATFTKVHVQKQSPGNIRYTSTPRAGSSKYLHTERIAFERRAEPLTAATGPSVSTLPPSADKSIEQPASGKKSPAVRASNTGIAHARKPQVSEISTSTAKSEVTVPAACVSKPQCDQQPVSRVRRGAAQARTSVPPGAPNAKDKLGMPSELSAEEQLNVDHPDEEHSMIQSGARVIAQYNQAFYPALICGVDGLNRYSVYFIEDGIFKAVPNNGVFPLSKLVPGVTTMISPSPDDLSPDTIGPEIEVVAVPDSSNAEEWKEGKFKVRYTDTGEEITVVWTQFYFRKQDADALKLKETATPLVKESNIVLEPRSSRRSRAAFNRSAIEQPKTPSTATPMARRSRPPKANNEDVLQTQPLVASTSRGDVNLTPDNAGQSVLVPLARRSSKYAKRVKLSEEDGKKAVGFEEKLSEQSGTTIAVAENTVGIDMDETSGITTSHSVTVMSVSDSLALDHQEAEKALDIGKKPEDAASTTSVKSHEDAIESAVVAQKEAPLYEENSVRKIRSQPTAIFRNRKFVLTASASDNLNSQAAFNKREIGNLIQQQGGTILQELEDIQGDNDEVYLIADTHHRTPKYLMALAGSVPCVHHEWISECIKQNALLDVKPYMLLAGKVDRPDGTSIAYEWKPQKSKLLAGKKVWIRCGNGSEPSAVDRLKQWSSVVACMGAEVIGDDRVPESDDEMFQWLTTGGVDFIVTDRPCESIISKAVNASKNVLVVTSDRIIEALITGELPDRTDDRLLAPAFNESLTKSRELFKNCKFVLSCSVRNSQKGPTMFNKGKMRRVIEKHGGIVVPDLACIGDDYDAYLIADTHYRTQRYIMALSLPVPCVHHAWITDCVKQGVLLDFKDYLLPAGQVLLPNGELREFECRPFKTTFLAGERVWVHSKKGRRASDGDFVKLWSPILANMGAHVVLDDDVPQTELDLQQWLKSGSINYLLKDRRSHDYAALSAVMRSNVVELNCEGLIDALIMGLRSDASQPPVGIFYTFKFVVSCGERNSQSGQPPRDKGEIRKLIEQHGGTFHHDFQDIKVDDPYVFLVADTFYRTSTYLTALSRGVPCLRVDWLRDCIEQKTILMEYDKYLLPAGKIFGPDGRVQQFKSKPGRDLLMKGMTIWVHSSSNTEPPSADFVQLWSPIVANLGADVVYDDQIPQGENELAQYITDAGIDVLLTDPSCERAVELAVETSANAVMVGREWVIDTLITGECPDPSCDRYRHDA